MPTTSETKTTTKATQDFVPVKEIRNGVIVLKDGSLRIILMASSINLALKSDNEQTAVITQFRNFLNALEFSVQMFVQSRRLDIRPYLALLEERHNEQLDDLMKIQVREYINFIRDFTEGNNIMTKTFFIVVPYDASVFQSNQSIIGRALGRGQKRLATEANDAFEQNRSQLEQRVSVIEQGLVRTGVRVARLGTEEAIEFFYKLFNPGELEKPIQLAEQAARAKK